MDETGKPTQHTAHIEAFCDGVFAVAATLLVLEVRVPGHDAVTAAGGLWRALGQHWSSYAAYALSFVVIGIMWANHHNIFGYIGRANHTFVMLNLALLFCVAFLPFPTAVLAQYLPSPQHPTPAAVLYGGTLTVTAVAYNAVWRYAAGGGRLLNAEADPQSPAAATPEDRLRPLLA